jgi:Xaa-Pro aminopeptidase
MNRYERRVGHLRTLIEDDEALFVNDIADVYYITGFTGDSSYLVLTRTQAYFITDGRYIEQIRVESGIELSVKETTAEYPFLKCLSDVAKEANVKTYKLDRSGILAASR